MNATLMIVIVFSICSMAGSSNSIDRPGWLHNRNSIVANTQKQTPSRAPQPKTDQEFIDFTIASGMRGGSAMEKAAEDFAVKYPDSEMRVLLFLNAMHEYHKENNPRKMITTGEKVLEFEPYNPIGLVLTAAALADTLSDCDPDREAKISKIQQRANRVLGMLDNFPYPSSATPEQISVYKRVMSSMAHFALGIMDLRIGSDKEAENELQLAAELSRDDPYIWYNLALAQDHLEKYSQALDSVNRALQYADLEDDIRLVASVERDRLLKQITRAVPRPGC